MFKLFKLGNLTLKYSSKKGDIKYQAIEFDPAKIEKCTSDLMELIKKDYLINETYQTDSGIVHELVK